MEEHAPSLESAMRQCTTRSTGGARNGEVRVRPQPVRDSLAKTLCDTWGIHAFSLHASIYHST